MVTIHTFAGCASKRGRRNNLDEPLIGCFSFELGKMLIQYFTGIQSPMYSDSNA